MILSLFKTYTVNIKSHESEKILSVSSFLSVLNLLPGAVAVNAQERTKVIAHRGYWQTAGSAQNSIRALVKADSIGCYGSEFDVWMTGDGVLVVNHDPNINGVRIQTSAASEVMPQGLSNGERIPTLHSYLDRAGKLNTRIILEMKEHDDKRREELVVKDIVAMVDARGLNDRVEYITFSKEGLHNFIKYAPKGTPVYYLSGDMTPQQLKEAGAAGLDYYIGTMRKHPEWFKEAHRLGLKVNVWTVNSAEDMRWCISQGADFITTNDPELLQSEISKQR